MKKPIAFLAAITLSTAASAGSMHESDRDDLMNENMNSMHQKMNAEHSGMVDNMTQPSILKNKEMQRLHKKMTLYGLSEVGMEARRRMIGPKGNAYHLALEKAQNTAR